VPDYLEFNFAPSSAWAAYRFEAYREGMAVLDLEPPAIVTLRGQRVLEVDVRIRLDSLAQRDADIRMGFSAVIEDKAGKLSYWACAHPEPEPDFHHADSFMCQLGDPHEFWT
jgi:hypothetical protein